MSVIKTASPKAKAGKPARKGIDVNRAAKAVQKLRKGTAAIILMLYQIADSGKKSGRAGGNVYMRNGRVRSMTVPALIRNAATTAARATLSTFSAGWNALTQSQRDSWNAISWYFKSDRFGNSVPVVGKQAYVSLNANLSDVSETLITDAPVNSGGGEATSIPMGTLDTVTPKIPTGDTVAPAGFAQKVFATAMLSPGVARPKKSAFRLIGVIAEGDTATPAEITTMYEAKFGASWRSGSPSLVGAHIFMQCIGVNIETGFALTGAISMGTMPA